MRLQYLLVSGVSTLIVIGAGMGFLPLLFADRVLPGIHIGDTSLSGIKTADIAAVLYQYQLQLEHSPLFITIRGVTHQYTVSQLGVSLNIPDTKKIIENQSWLEVLAGESAIKPHLSINADILQQRIAGDYALVLSLPQNASLYLTPRGTLEIIKSKSGQGVPLPQFEQQLTAWLSRPRTTSALSLSTAIVKPLVEDSEVEGARRFATILLTDGFMLEGSSQGRIEASTLRRLLTFEPQLDPATHSNYILGVRFNDTEFTHYLDRTILPLIDRPAVNARFELSQGALVEISAPQSGQHLDTDRTKQQVAQALSSSSTRAPLIITVEQPIISGLNDINAADISALLATGESSFAGSPANRIHNIETGLARYHGLLIPPQAEFSFNEFLGPVTAETGFKPELVIKHDKTVPEFGGGLCQVSTTMFRAAARSGLPITERRNHAYVVRYYGIPGFDATIYPGVADLRFTNDTGHYLLIQGHIDGKLLRIEFWGTPDNRQVEIVGPNTYDRKSDGSLKAVLRQKITKAGVTKENVFYSRYRSPALFPKVLGATASIPKP